MQLFNCDGSVRELLDRGRDVGGKQLIHDSQRADNAVLVEAVPPVRSAERSLVLVDQLVMTILHLAATGREGRMSVIEFANDLRRINSTSVVKRHAICLPTI